MDVRSFSLIVQIYISIISRVFFFNDTATTEIYTLSLHDALPICRGRCRDRTVDRLSGRGTNRSVCVRLQDRKSTRLNSSHTVISYAVFCLKKKKNKQQKESQELQNTLNSQVNREDVTIDRNAQTE